MFNESSGCRIVGMSYTSKHYRFSLSLLPSDGKAEFSTAFVDVAAYSDSKTILGKIVTSVEIVRPIELIQSDWGRIIRADMAGTWPGPLPSNPQDAADFVTKIGLNGYRINVEDQEYGWALSRDYVRLGRRSRT